MRCGISRRVNAESSLTFSTSSSAQTSAVAPLLPVALTSATLPEWEARITHLAGRGVLTGFAFLGKLPFIEVGLIGPCKADGEWVAAVTSPDLNGDPERAACNKQARRRNICFRCHSGAVELRAPDRRLNRWARLARPSSLSSHSWMMSFLQA